MNSLPFIKLLLVVLILSLSGGVSEAQSFKRYSSGYHGRNMIRKPPGKRKEVKIREPRVVEKAKKKQAAREKQKDKDYARFIKENRKHSIEIQTPDVQARMKQNRKDAEANYKAKKKNNASGMKKAGKKYRR